jgi:hypothetical protein
MTPSPLRIRRENVIFCRHRRMTRVPALGVDPIRRKRVGRGVIEKLGVCPSARVRESVGILFDVHSIFATLEPLGRYRECRTYTRSIIA